jgi:hypothetical protein
MIDLPVYFFTSMICFKHAQAAQQNNVNSKAIIGTQKRPPQLGKPDAEQIYRPGNGSEIA